MKKILIALLACLMVLTLVACEGEVDINVNVGTTTPAVTTTTPAPQNPPVQPPVAPKLGLHFSSIEADGSRLSAQINEAKDLVRIVVGADVFSEEGASVTAKLIIKNDSNPQRTLHRASEIINDFSDAFSIEYDLVENTTVGVDAKTEINVTVQCIQPLEENQKVVIFIDLIELSGNQSHVYVQASGERVTGGGIEEDGNGAFWTPPY